MYAFFHAQKISSFTYGYEVFLNMFESSLKLGWPVSYDKTLCFVDFLMHGSLKFCLKEFTGLPANVD